MAATHKVRVPMADQIPPPNYGHHVEPLPKQDVVPIDIVPDQFPEEAVKNLVSMNFRLS